VIRWGVRIWVLALVAGCYSPNYEANVPCSADLTCPGSEVCDTSKAPPLCVSQLGGGSGSDIDASMNVGVDAAQVVTCGNAICTNPTPVCDSDSTTCRSCYSDSECSSHICSESTGTCLLDAQTLYVKNGGDDANTCTHDAPCANVSRALQLVDQVHNTIKIYDGNYSDAFASTASYLLSGEGNQNTNATIHYKSNGHAHVLEVDSGGTVVVEGVSFDGGMQETMRAQGNSTLTLYNAEVENSPIGGIDSAMSNIHLYFSTVHDSGGTEPGVNIVGGSLSMLRSLMYDQANACVHVQSAKYDIENTFLLGCTTVAFDQAGIVENPATFTFNTIANSGTAVTCAGAINVKNSIFANNGAPQIPANASATYSLFTDTPPTGTGNIMGDPNFVANDDFHINFPSPAIDSAEPNSTNNIDFDGDFRPHFNKWDIGADEHY
jgi:hypothetical protein